jgi:outer membrane receptor protein involved in Fe transport
METESWAAYNTIYGPLDPTDVRWSSDERNKRTDWAVFGEATVDLSDKWKMLIGARWYDVKIDRTYTLKVPATGPADISTPSGSDSGILPKFGFQYFFEDDRMVYALYSEGFRTGGINRARGNPTLPVEYGPDLLNNYEAGLKSQWMNGKLQFNLIGYHQVWKDMQLELTDPSYNYGEPFQTVIANVGDAVVDGFDLEIFYQASDHVQLGWVSTYLFNAKIKDDIQVFDDRDPEDLALDVPGGTRLPLTADLNFSAFAEYNWQTSMLGGSQAYVRVQTSYTGDSYNRLVDNDDDPDGTGYGGRAKQPHYNTWDLRTGLSNSDWEATFFLNNIFDKRGVTFIDTNADWFWGRQNYLVIQPRTIGVHLKRYFN